MTDRSVDKMPGGQLPASGKALELGPLRQDLPFLSRNLRALLRTEGTMLRERLGIESGMIGVLNIVWLNPGISQNDLAGSVALKKSAVTKVVQLLEANKLLARQRTQSDRRYKALKLTPAGEELVRNIRLETDRLHAEWFEGVKQDDRDIFFDVLIRILANLGRKYGGALDAEES